MLIACARIHCQVSPASRLNPPRWLRSSSIGPVGRGGGKGVTRGTGDLKNKLSNFSFTGSFPAGGPIRPVFRTLPAAVAVGFRIPPPPLRVCALFEVLGLRDDVATEVEPRVIDPVFGRRERGAVGLEAFLPVLESEGGVGGIAVSPADRVSVPTGA